MRRIGTLTTILLGIFFSISLATSSLTVAFNQKTYKYHYQSCTWAHKCTVNCIDISLSEAIAKGGVPCKVFRPPASVTEE